MKKRYLILAAMLAAETLLSGMNVIAAEKINNAYSDVGESGYAIDASLASSWESTAEGDSITIELSGTQEIEKISVLLENSINLKYKFSVETSENGAAYTKLAEVESTEKTDYHHIKASVKAKFIRFTGTGKNALKISDIRINEPEAVIESTLDGMNTDISLKSASQHISGINKGTKLDTAVRFLTADGIDVLKTNISGEFDTEAYVTNGEFAETILRVIGMNRGDIAISGLRKGKTFWETRSTINEQLEELFKTEKSMMTYIKAQKILITLAAHEGRAEFADTPYPTGYYKAAIELGITKGVTGGSENDLKAGDAALMIYNTLHIQMPDDSDNAEFGEKKTVMDAYMGVKEAEGIVSETNLNTLTNDKYHNSFVVTLDDKITLIDPDNMSEYYIGREVKYYYKADEWDDVLVFMQPKSDIEMLTVNADDIDGATISSGEIIRLKYYNGRRVKSADIKASPVSIYNLKNYKGFTYEDLNIKNGSIDLFDNDGNGVFDAVRIYEYIDKQVKDVNVKEETIYFDDKDKTFIDLSEMTNGYDIYINGLPGRLSELEMGCIISANMSKDGSYARIEARNDSFTGRVSGISNEDGIIKAEIGGEIFKLSDEFIKRYFTDENGTVDFTGLTGTLAVFSVNVYGNLATMSGAPEQELSYGVLLDCIYMEDEEKAAVKMLTSSGTIKKFFTLDTLRVNGVKTDCDKLVQTSRNQGGDFLWVSYNASVEYDSRRLVEYRLDAEGNIIDIKEAAKGKNALYGYNNFTSEMKSAPSGSELTETAPKGTRKIKGRSGKYSAWETLSMEYEDGSGDEVTKNVTTYSFDIADDTVIFIIPQPEAGVTEYSVDESLYSVTDITHMVTEEVQCTAYNRSGGDKVDFLVTETEMDYNPGFDGGAELITLIERISCEDGEVRTLIECVNSLGEKKSHILYDDDVYKSKHMPYVDSEFVNKLRVAGLSSLNMNDFNQLKAVFGTRELSVGDVILPGDNFGGYMRGLRVIFDSDMMKERRDEAMENGDLSLAYSAIFTTFHVEPQLSSNNNTSYPQTSECYPFYGKVTDKSDDGKDIQIQTNLRVLSQRVLDTRPQTYKIMTRPNIIIPVNTAKFDPNITKVFYKINMKRKTIEQIQPSEVGIGDEVFVRYQKGSVREVFVYEWE